MNNSGVDTTIFLFDFDSTFVTVEALDELANIALANAPDRAQSVAAIAEITADGMAGLIGFDESLARRFAQISPSKAHFDALVTLLKHSVSPSFVANKDFFQKNAETIYIVSGGFKDFIVPVVAEFGIDPSHVLANEFTWSSEGQTITGYDTANPLAHNGGKIKAIQALNLPKNAHKIMIGDGMTDYAVRGVGAVNEFIAYTDTVKRKPVIEVADFVATSIDDVLAHTIQPRAIQH